MSDTKKGLLRKIVEIKSHKPFSTFLWLWVTTLAQAVLESNWRKGTAPRGRPGKLLLSAAPAHTPSALERSDRRQPGTSKTCGERVRTNPPWFLKASPVRYSRSSYST